MNKPGINKEIQLKDLVYKDNDNNLVLGVTITKASVNPYTTISDATSTGITAQEVANAVGKPVDSLVVNVPSGGGKLKVLSMDGITTTWYFTGTEAVNVKAVISDADNTTSTIYIGY